MDITDLCELAVINDIELAQIEEATVAVDFHNGGYRYLGIIERRTIAICQLPDGQFTDDELEAAIRKQGIGSRPSMEDYRDHVVDRFGVRKHPKPRGPPTVEVEEIEIGLACERRERTEAVLEDDTDAVAGTGMDDDVDPEVSKLADLLWKGVRLANDSTPLKTIPRPNYSPRR